jgi:hypothetical protein
VATTTTMAAVTIRILPIFIVHSNDSNNSNTSNHSNRSIHSKRRRRKVIGLAVLLGIVIVISVVLVVVFTVSTNKNHHHLYRGNGHGHSDEENHFNCCFNKAYSYGCPRQRRQVRPLPRIRCGRIQVLHNVKH